MVCEFEIEKVLFFELVIYMDFFLNNVCGGVC